MDFIDQLRLLSSRISNTINLIQTEEATKNAMVMPFIQILGYNPFDPLEVTPELISDVGTKKGEKVDYAIMKEGRPIIIFECKKAGGDLNIKHAGQLFRYFHVTEARFGVLTNGLIYRFFTDLEQPNKMDEKPFFEFNILDFKDKDVEELKKFAKTAFDIETILNTANDLKYVRAVQQKINEFMTAPTDDFVKLVTADLIGSKRFTPALKEQFSTITIRAFEQLLGDKINERLKGAMSQSGSAPVVIVTSKESPTTADEPINEKTDPQVITTPEELEGFYAIRAMLREVIQPKRVTMRDAQSYCAILLDNNNRKPICRLRFNNVNKLRISVFNENKEEEIFPLESVDQLFEFAEKLKIIALSYE